MNVEGEFTRPLAVDVNSLNANGFGMVQFDQGDHGMVVNFRWERVRNAALSKEKGRPYFERKIYVTIHPPGERLNIIDREVKEDDRYRWPRQWNAFCANQVQVPEGTPVAQLFPAHPEISGNLEGWGVYTVEQLANLSGTAVDSVGMGAQAWVNKARQYLERAQKGVAHHTIEEMERRHASEVRALHNTISDLNVKIGKLMDIVNSQPGYVGAMAQDAGVHEPYRRHDLQGVNIPGEVRPHSIEPVPVPGAPFSPIAPAPAPQHLATITRDFDGSNTGRVSEGAPQPVDTFLGARTQTHDWIEPPSGFFSDGTHDAQTERLNANHPGNQKPARPQLKERPRTKRS